MKSALIAHTHLFIHEKSSLEGEGTGLSRSNDFSCLVMASDEGKGMRSSVSKCLHRIAGKPLLLYTLEALKEARPRAVALVAGADFEEISALARRIFPEIEVFHQSEHRGTADALMCARQFVDSCPDDIIVAYADTPFIQTTTYTRLRASLFYGAAIGIVGFTSPHPQGFGRIIQSVDGRITGIREEAFLNIKERLIQLCNAGPLALEASVRHELVERLARKLVNEGAEITDLVYLANETGLKVRMQSVGEEEAFAVNNRIQLSLAERVMQDRLRQAAMLSGVTMIDPESVTLCHDTLFGQDVVVEPNVVFGPNVFVETGARVAAFSYFEDCTVRARSSLS